MRKPIILYLMLFCLTQYCSGSETEKEALKEKQEKSELNFSLDNEVMKSVKERINYLTFLELCFAKPEFLELIKNDSSFRDAWKEKVAGIPIPKKGYSNIQNEFFKFFNGVFLKDQTGNYSEQVAFLKQYHPKVIENKYLSEPDYGNKIAKYGKSDDFIYNMIFDLLILDPKNFLDEIDKNPNAKDGFHRWLIDVEGVRGINPISSAPYGVLERERDYIVSSLERIENPLAKEALDVLKNAAIIPVD